MQNWPIILHMKLLLSLVLGIHGAIKFTVLSSLQNAKTCKTFSSWMELPGRFCRARSLLLEDVFTLAPSLHEESDALAAPLLGPGSGECSVTRSPASTQQ